MNLISYIRSSIKLKFMLMVAFVFTFLILLVAIANVVFLPKYYQFRKLSSLSSTMTKVNCIIDKEDAFLEDTDNGFSDDAIREFEKMEADGALYMYVFQPYILFDKVICDIDFPSKDAINETESREVREKVRNYVLRDMDMEKLIEDDDKEKMISEMENASIYMVYDDRIGSYYVELFGCLDCGSYIYMRTNFQSIKESISISNKFLAYIGIFAMFFGMIIMFMVSNSVISPIKRMTCIAEKMANLDFEAKYPVTTNDEIGQLGGSINTLSETLETTISDLKTANNELKNDIEQKTQIDEMRKDFLSNVSHELKTPIALIQGYAEGLADNINDDYESRKFYCDVIQDEAAKMNNMVKKLLTLNQIEFQSGMASFERFDIVQVVNSVVNSARLLADQKEAEIEIDDHDSIFVWADEYLIEEVITNYVSNAINHVDFEKKIHVYYEDKKDVLRINVFNTGLPIPEEDIDKVWIKFYKVDKARTREYGGSGIGLSIVKAIMDSMNRECGVENKDNGVNFWFEVDKKVET